MGEWGMNEYERIADIIRCLDESHAERSDAVTPTACVGLNPCHRLFPAWGGITPEYFLQCLSLARAKNRLVKGAAVLQIAVRAVGTGMARSCPE